jgi:hypothetical protein
VGPFVPVHGGIFLLLPAPQNGVQAGRRTDRSPVTDEATFDENNATEPSYDTLAYMDLWMV